MVELNHLQSFYWVAVHRGFMRASRARHIAQSALSRAVRLLEAELGFAVFHRHGREITLTERGREVFEHFHEAQRRIENIRDLGKGSGKTNAEAALLSGQLRLAVVDAVAWKYLDLPIRELGVRHPDLFVAVESLPAHQACERLVSGEINAAIQYILPSRFRPLIQSRGLAKHGFRLVTANHSGKTLRRFIGSRKVDEVLPSGMPGLELLRSRVPDAEVVLSTNSVLLQETWCRRGAGVALLPEYLLEGRGSPRLLSAGPKRSLEFELLLLTRNRATADPALSEFLKYALF